jgi:fructose-1-phosphate kinase PfkB-like protein
MKVLTLGLSPTIQKTILFPTVRINAVNRSEWYRLDAAGKAVGVARMLRQYGVQAINISPVGNENAGDFLSLCSLDGIEIRVVPVPGRVRYCYTLLDGSSGDTTELVVDEPSPRPNPEPKHGPKHGPTRPESDACGAVAERIIETVASALSGMDGVVLAGSIPPGYPVDLYARVCAMADAANVPVIADYRGLPLQKTLSGTPPRIIKINDEEFAQTFLHHPAVSRNPSSSNSESGSRSSPADTAPDEPVLIEEMKRRSLEYDLCIVVTRGPKDVLASYSGDLYRYPVTPVKPVSPIGCGDAFTAGFFSAWLEQTVKESATARKHTHRDDIFFALARGTAFARTNALNNRPGALF